MSVWEVVKREKYSKTNLHENVKTCNFIHVVGVLVVGDEIKESNELCTVIMVISML